MGNSAPYEGKPIMSDAFLELISDFAKNRKDSGETVRFLEYGAGNSTCYWASNPYIDEMVSVEANSQWGDFIKQKIQNLSEETSRKITLHVVAVDDLQEKEKLGGKIGWSEKFKDWWVDYSDYAKDNYPKENFDIIIVDGHDRKRCFIKCIDLLKKGGMLLFHDIHSEEFNTYDPKDRSADTFSDLVVNDYINFGSGRGNLGMVCFKK